MQVLSFSNCDFTETVMKMCSLILLCLFVSLPAMAAETSEEKEMGFWFEARVDSKKSAQVVGWYEHEFTDMFGVYGLVSLENEDRYRQAYAGIALKPLPKSAPWLQIGAGLGRERDIESSGVRRNIFVSVDSEKVSGFATYENGMTGPWHRVHAVYRVTDTISVGAMKETGLGFGPRAEYNIKKNLQFWIAILRSPETKETTSVFAVNFSF
jgi:hypothetical protein